MATIGPASDTPTGLQDLMRAGVDVVRLNLSHGTIDEHLLRLSTVRAAAEAVGKEVAVLADLPGPKIRSGRFPEGGAVLAVGEMVELRAGDEPSGSHCIYVQYETLLEDLMIGGHVMLGDGAISMSVQSVGDECAIVRVETGGTANGQPGVHLPSDKLRLTTPTDEDLVLAEEMATAGVEFIAVSFVRQAIDVQRVRDVVGSRAQLIAKIETSSSIANLDDIVKMSDAVMVARGDLGIDCPIEDVPPLQKKIIRHCVEVGTPVITATQMLESMITASAPTRAEVSDVANAAILCCTNSGRTARAMARFRPDAAMIALSPEASMVRSLALTWGVIPMQVGTYESTDEMVWFAVETALRAGMVRHGDTVVVLAGAPAQRQTDLDRNLPKRSWVGRAASDVMRIVHVD